MDGGYLCRSDASRERPLPSARGVRAGTGERLGDYEEIEVVGRGNFGTALLVRAPDGQLRIAKKVVLGYLSESERAAAFHEVEVLRSLDHPNIVGYVENFLQREMLVIVMHYCDHGDLCTAIKRQAEYGPPFQEVQVMNWFVQICQALSHIHERKILHRDLKASNVFLSSRRRVVKIGDFGISRVLEGTHEAAMTVVGTPYYMSPEVCENKPYTFQSDVWAVGCILYELCTFKHAFTASNLLGLVYKIVSEEHEPISTVYSDDLSSLVDSLLTKSPTQRPRCGEILQLPYVHRFMEEYVRSHGACTREPRSPRADTPRRRRRRQEESDAGSPRWSDTGSARSPLGGPLSSPSCSSYEDDFEDGVSSSGGSADLEVSRVVGNYQAVLNPLLYEHPIRRDVEITSQLEMAKHECIAKMGQANFDKAYSFLWDARARDVSEAEVRRKLMTLVGSDLYNRCCFEVDQIVYRDLDHRSRVLSA